MLRSLATTVLLMAVWSSIPLQAPPGTFELDAVIEGSAPIVWQGLKVHISVDMEGLAGVVDSSHTSRRRGATTRPRGGR